MAESLMDFGGAARTMLGMGQLAQEQRRNDIDEEQGRQLAESRQLTALLSLSKDPRVQADTQLSDNVLMRAGKLARAPEISPLGLARGRDQYRKMLEGLDSKDPQMAMHAHMELQVMLGPDDAAKVVASAQGVQKLSEFTETIETMRQLQQERFEKIHDAMAKVNAGQEPYSEGVRYFTTLLTGTDAPAFMRTSKAAAKMQPAKGSHPRTVGAALALDNADVSKFGGPQYMQAATQASTMAQKFLEQVSQSSQLLQLVDEMGEPLPKGVTKRDLVERIDVGKTLVDAYSTMSTWADDPYNLTKLKDVKAARTLITTKRSELDAIKASTAQESVNIRRDALTFRESEAGKKHLYEKSVGQAQTDVLDRFGRNPSPKDLASVAKKYGVAPNDILPALADPTKKGQMNINLLSPGERKDIAEDRTMVSQLNALMKDFKPGYVGMLDAKLGKLGQATSTISKDRESWLQRSRALLTDLRFSRFGASLTENEMKAAMSELPNESMGNNQWPAAAKAWRDKWGRLIDERFAIANESRGGKGAAPSRGDTPSTAEEFLELLGVK